MGFFSKFENKVEDTFENAAGKMFDAPISPVQIAKKAEKQMRREAMVGAGKEYAPTLYTVLVNPDDDRRLFGYYPTLAGETETYLKAKAQEEGMVMDGQPLVRFVVDDGLRSGKFDIIAEPVAAPIVRQLREEEMIRYGLAQAKVTAAPQQVQNAPAPANDPFADPLAKGTSDYGAYESVDVYGTDDAEAEAVQADAPVPAPAHAPAHSADLPPENAEAPDMAAYDEPESFESQQDPAPEPAHKPPLPYVPEEEIDYSIDYGEYTFNSEDFEDYRDRETLERVQAKRPQRQDSPNTAIFAGRTSDGTVPNQAQVTARLIDTAYKRTYNLGGTHLALGRGNDNDIVVQDINASRHHAELKLTPQGVWTITDVGSMNGTLVNGMPIAAQTLYDGDLITIGKTDFEFLQS